MAQQDADGDHILEEEEMTISGLLGQAQRSQWYQFGIVLAHLSCGLIAYGLIFNLKSLDATAQVNNVVDSLYFAVIVFTTVGYGDFVPDSVPGKLFTIVFAYVGVWIIASRVSMLVEALLSSQEEALTRMLHDDQNLTDEEKSSILVEQSEALVCGFQRPDFERLRISMAIYFVLLLIGCGIFVWHYDNQQGSYNPIVDGFYWATITSMTIGFGDKTKSHHSD